MNSFSVKRQTSLKAPAAAMLVLASLLLFSGCSAGVGSVEASRPASPPENSNTQEKIQELLLTEEERSARDIEMATLKVAGFPSTDEERRFWTKAINQIWLRPPCCGACSTLSADDFRMLINAVGEDAKDTPENRQVWQQYGSTLVAAVKNQNPALYEEYRSIVEGRTTEAKL